MKEYDGLDNRENRPYPWESMEQTWLTTAPNVPNVKTALTFYTEVMEMVAIAE